MTEKDKSQPLKAADPGAAAASANAELGGANAQERPAQAAGPKASDIPAEQIKSADGQTAGPAVLDSNEYTVNKSTLIRILGAHLGLDVNNGVTDLVWDTDGNVSVKHHRTA